MYTQCVLYSIYYIRYMYVSYQSHQITFVALHRCLRSRSLRSCPRILILLCCHLLKTLQMWPHEHGLTRDTCQTRPTYYQLMHLIYTYRHDHITIHYFFAFIRCFCVLSFAKSYVHYNNYCTFHKLTSSHRKKQLLGHKNLLIDLCMVVEFFT